MDPVIPSTEQFVATVRSEMTAVKEALRKHFNDDAAERYTKTQEEFADIRAKLTKLAEAGQTAPDAQKVQDLEARQIAAERTLLEITTRLAAVQVDAAVTKEQRDATLFKGRLFKDEEGLRKVIRAMGGRSAAGDAEVRAIDQSLFATGGQLSPETADRFLDFVITMQVALSRVTTIRMMAPERHTDELTVSSRKLRKATPGVSQAVADAIGTKRRTLTSVPVIWPEDIVLEFLEDNIERQGAESHIMQLLARQFGNDLNDLAWNGAVEEDSSGGDPFLSINQGWIAHALADAEVHDVTSYVANITNGQILRQMFRALPVNFKAMPGLGFFVPVLFAERYADELATRETSLGDQVVINGLPALRHFGLPVVAEPHLYEDTEDKAMLTPFQNLYHGIQRQIMIDSMWQPRPGKIEVTIRARNDYQYATGDGIVLASGIPEDNR